MPCFIPMLIQSYNSVQKPNPAQSTNVVRYTMNNRNIMPMSFVKSSGCSSCKGFKKL